MHIPIAISGRLIGPEIAKFLSLNGWRLCVWEGWIAGIVGAMAAIFLA